jgi:hypothetical protein
VMVKKMGTMVGALGLTWALGSAALAQGEVAPASNEPVDGTKQVRVGEGTPRGSVPPVQNVEEPPPPPAPAVTLPESGVIKQAGIGSPIAYGRVGVLELGGSAGFSAASNYTRFNLSPSIGWFIVDNVELSLLTGLNYFRVGSTDTTPETSATEVSALVEPSFHLPFSEQVFGFIGLGAGVNYITDSEVGFAVQPRLGANFMVGRSGILTPSFNVAYSTVEAIRTQAGTVLAVRTSYGLNIGYTVMW